MRTAFVITIIFVSKIGCSLQQGLAPIPVLNSTACPEGDQKKGYVYVGHSASCECLKSSTGPQSGIVQWFNSEGKRVGSSGDTAVINFKALSDDSFYCKGIDDQGKEGQNVTFPLKIAYGPSGIDFSVTPPSLLYCPGSQNTVRFQCKVLKDGVSPNVTMNNIVSGVEYYAKSEYIETDTAYIANIYARPIAFKDSNVTVKWKVANSIYTEYPTTQFFTVEMKLVSQTVPIFSYRRLHWENNSTVVVNDGEEVELECKGNEKNSQYDTIIACACGNSTTVSAKNHISFIVDSEKGSCRCQCNTVYYKGCLGPTGTITFGTTWPSEILSFTVANETVLKTKQGDVVQFECKAKYAPGVYLTLYHRDTYIPYYKSTVKDGFVFLHVNHQVTNTDSGDWLCQLRYNRPGKPINSTSKVNLVVEGPIYIKYYDESSISLNSKRARLRIPFNGYPDPEIVTVTKLGIPRRQVPFTEEVIRVADAYDAILFLTLHNDHTTGDLEGRYKLKMDNRIGQPSEFTFNLQYEDKRWWYPAIIYVAVAVGFGIALIIGIVVFIDVRRRRMTKNEKILKS